MPSGIRYSPLRARHASSFRPERSRRRGRWASEVATAGDGSVMAIARDDGVVEIRDALTDLTRSMLAVPGAAIADAALDPRGQRLALGRIHGTVEVWTTAPQELVLRIHSHAGRVAAVAFSRDGWDEIAHVLALCPERP